LLATFAEVEPRCINQDDIKERNEHVKIMDKIYAGASTVRIWLGEEVGQEMEAMNAFEEVDAVLNELIVERDLRGNRDAFQYAFMNYEKMRTIDWGALDSILSRAWFQRVWVVQEVPTQDKHPYILGSSSCPGNTSCQTS
jgi:Heterokaryon incompatibility protein (HET)